MPGSGEYGRFKVSGFRDDVATGGWLSNGFLRFSEVDEMASKDHSDLIATLRQSVSGAVVSPSDGDYNKQRQPWLEVVDQRPVAIVNAMSVDDISRTVRFATEQGLPLGVQNTGHGITRACDGGILLRLAEMKEVSVDVSNRTATIGPGVSSGNC